MGYIRWITSDVSEKNQAVINKFFYAAGWSSAFVEDKKKSLPAGKKAPFMDLLWWRLQGFDKGLNRLRNLKKAAQSASAA